MQALLSVTPGGPETLRLETVEEPRPGFGEVVIAVAACGLNFPDLLLIQDLYQVKPKRPFAPGAEVAGVIESVGPGVTDLRPGDRVIGRCGWGGMAEKIAIAQDRCTRIPDAMPFEHSAAFIFTYATAYYALKTRADLKAGEKVLVLGASGGVGLASLQIAKALGAQTIAAASSEAKLDFARQHGADSVVGYPKELDAENGAKEFASSLRQVAGQGGIDVAVDPVGGMLSEPAIRCMAEGGRYLILGFAGGIPKIPMNLPLLKSCDVLGINWRTFLLAHPAENRANEAALFELYERGLIAPVVTERFPLARGAEAIEKIRDRSVLGKIVVTMR